MTPRASLGLENPFFFLNHTGRSEPQFSTSSYKRPVSSVKTHLFPRQLDAVQALGLEKRLLQIPQAYSDKTGGKRGARQTNLMISLSFLFQKKFKAVFLIVRHHKT